MHNDHHRQLNHYSISSSSNNDAFAALRASLERRRQAFQAPSANQLQARSSSSSYFSSTSTLSASNSPAKQASSIAPRIISRGPYPGDFTSIGPVPGLHPRSVCGDRYVVHH